MSLHRSLFGPVVWVWFGCVLVLSGCSKAPQSPLEQAEDHLDNSRFTEAIQVAEAELGRTTDTKTQSQLWALKGRCYWNQNGSAQSNADWEHTVEAMTKSIELSDNAEARHIRSLAYEKLKKMDLAAADKKRWIELDPIVRKSAPDIDLEPTRSTLSTDNEPAETETPDQWTPRSSDEGTTGLPTDAGSTAPVEDPKPTRRSTSGKTPSARKSLLAGERRDSQDESTSGAGELAGNDTESEGDTSDTPPETPKDESEDTGTPAPRPSRTSPSSTWQPIAQPQTEGQTPWSGLDGGPSGTIPGSFPQATSPPPTGLIGPSSSYGVAPNSGSESFGPPPTGLVGPPGFTNGPSASNPSNYGPPPTGIVGPSTLRPGAGPNNITGNFSINGPAPASPLVPYTGALPPDQRPTDPRAANFFNQGPNYSPLRPSPLTNPNMLQPRLPSPSYTRNPYLNPSGGGNTSTLPSSRPASPPAPRSLPPFR